MKLPDVNIWLALALSGHSHHEAARTSCLKRTWRSMSPSRAVSCTYRRIDGPSAIAFGNDEAATATLRASPTYVGKIGTTCVPTMIEGGHAQNALPQRATANVNCRVFPGHSREEIRLALETIAATPGVDGVFIGPADLSASMGHVGNPGHPEVQAAIQKVVDLCKKHNMPCGTLSSRGRASRRRSAPSITWRA